MTDTSYLAHRALGWEADLRPAPPDHDKQDLDRASAALETVYRTMRDDGYFDNAEDNAASHARAKTRLHELEVWLVDVFRAVRGEQLLR